MAAGMTESDPRVQAALEIYYALKESGSSMTRDPVPYIIAIIQSADNTRDEK